MGGSASPEGTIMTVPLSDQFVAATRQKAIEVSYAGRTLTISASNAVTGLIRAELVVRDGETVLGYITPYSSSERGATKARFFGMGAPRVFSTLEEALTEISS